MLHFLSFGSMNKKWTIWAGWLVLVAIWNFVWPSVPPIADVVVAAGLSFISMGVTKVWKD